MFTSSDQWDGQLDFKTKHFGRRGISFLKELQEVFFSRVFPPGHFGERKHQLGLDVPLLADQRHREGTCASGASRGREILR